MLSQPMAVASRLIKRSRKRPLAGVPGAALRPFRSSMTHFGDTGVVVVVARLR